MTKNLYHYCSVETFLNIIGNETIRASDCSKTNDTEETRWIATMIENVFVEIIEDSEVFRSKYNITENKLDNILNKISSVIKSTFSQNRRQMTTYTTCFSENGDLLSQWRAYANDAKGISIGFNKNILQTFDTGGYNYHFKKVIYKPQEQKLYVKNYLGDLVHAYESTEINKSTDIDETIQDFLFDLCMTISTMRNDSAQYKNKTFEAEQEWRLFVNNHHSNLYCYEHENDVEYAANIDENYRKKCEYSNGIVRGPTKFLSTDTCIISYFDLNFGKIKNDFINEIIIGPKCEATIFDIQLLLATNNYNYNKIKIHKSEVTYR